MTYKVSIKLNPYPFPGAVGWEWTVVVTGGGLEGPFVGSYRTNREGDGRWHWNGDEWRQANGTGQFRLPKSRAAAYSRIRRWELKRWAED